MPILFCGVSRSGRISNCVPQCAEIFALSLNTSVTDDAAVEIGPRKFIALCLVSISTIEQVVLFPLVMIPNTTHTFFHAPSSRPETDRVPLSQIGRPLPASTKLEDPQTSHNLARNKCQFLAMSRSENTRLSPLQSTSMEQLKSNVHMIAAPEPQILEIFLNCSLRLIEA